jgi:hypothetical protein
MQLIVDLEGPGSAAETTELRAWLHNARIKGVEKVTQEESPPKRGEQGPALLAILTIVLGSRALVELVHSIHRYVEARTSTIKIKITAGKKTIEIDCKNPPALVELVKQAKILAAD